MLAVSNPDSKLIFVFGLSHVGKTTISDGVYEQILEDFDPSLAINIGTVAAIRNEILAPPPGKPFDWPDFIVRLHPRIA